MQGATNKSRRKVAAVLLPFALLLTACESTNTVGITEDGRMEVSAHIRDDSGLFAQQFKCEDIVKEMNISEFDKAKADIDIKDNTSGDTLDCTINIKTKGTAVDGDTLTETADTYVLKLGNDSDTAFTEKDLQMLKQFNVQFTLNVAMPGDIIKADGATIHGNTAKYSNLAVLGKTVLVEGKKHAKGSVAATKEDKKEDSKKDSGSKDSDLSKDSDSDKAKDSGFSILPWALGGLVILGLIGVGVFFLIRKKSNDDPAQGYGFDGQSPYGQAPYGQTPGAPYQYNPQQGMPQQGSASPFSYAEAPAPTQPVPGQAPVVPMPLAAQPPAPAVPPITPAPSAPIQPGADAVPPAPETTPEPSDNDGNEHGGDTPDYNNWRQQ